MKTFTGISASKGVVIGKLVVYNRNKIDIQKKSISDPDKEWLRFLKAQDEAVKDLDKLIAKIKVDAGDEAASLLETHQMMAEDIDFVEGISKIIKKDKLCAEYAVYKVAKDFEAMFETMENEYMRSRSEDVADVGRRIIRKLMSVNDSFTLTEPSILISDDLSPSETSRLDKSKLLAVCIRKGSMDCHSSILVRMLGIPGIIMIGEDLSPYSKLMAICDGDSGKLIIDYDDKTLKLYQDRIREQNKVKDSYQKFKGLKTLTKSQNIVSLYCNIASPEDVESVIENDGEGIGLFRSEFLFLGHNDFPSEEEQFDSYSRVLKAMKGKEVIIRTCDIGADKKVDYLKLEDEANPSLGLRGIRLSFAYPEMFKTQLRALYRASVHGNLSIMFPMITSVWEVEKIKNLCLEVKRELGMETSTVKLGIMVETPSCALLTEELGSMVDFFSIGTNDLTQYTLACDRENSLVKEYSDPLHPSLMRLIKMIIDNGHKNGIRVGLCGELAGDERVTERLVRMGLDEFSVPPSKVLYLRSLISNL